MRVVAFTNTAAVASLFQTAGRGVDMIVDFAPSVQEFGSQLHRDPDAIGLIYGEGWAEPVEVAHDLREAGILNLIFYVVDLDMPEGGRRATARARILNAGADDVQSLPIEAAEISGRLMALRRRPPVTASHLIPIADGFFDTQAHKLIRDEVMIHLTRKEAALLELLATNPGTCVSKHRCMQALYEERDEPGEKIIDVFLCKLRKKLAHICGDHDPIDTVWGQGYRFVAGEAAA